MAGQKERLGLRKSRPGEVVCRCRAYRFPHRLTGGACVGVEYVEATWEANYGGGECRECRYLDDEYGDRQCQVVNGAEPARACPVFQELLRANEVRLYGPAWTTFSL